MPPGVSPLSEPGGPKLSVWKWADASHRPDMSADDLSGYARRPFAFMARYLRRRAVSHSIILAAVLAAVTCSVSTQYGVKFLVDTLAGGARAGGPIWLAFFLLVALIALHNLLPRLATWGARGA